MEGKPRRDFLLDLKWLNPLLVQTFEVGRHTPVDLDLEMRRGLGGEAQPFNSDLEEGRHSPLIQISRHTL